jgi:segregation and condensation protein B
MFYEHLKGPMEAMLFAAGDPLKPERLSELLDIPLEHVQAMIMELQEDMNRPDRGLCLMHVAGGYQICTKPEYAAVVEKMAAHQDPRLSPAAMETLSIIAFKQPVTRQEVEYIRGVQSDGVINTLIERRLTKEVGRKETIGRPILFGTTEEFLSCFGLNSLTDLPALPEPLPEESGQNEPGLGEV